MINLSKIKKVYVIGIKGSGVIAVVEILHSLGIEISGSDTKEKFFTDEILQDLDIKYFEKFSVENIPEKVDLVIYSSSYNEDNNVEIREAKKRNLPMISYPEMLAEFFNKKYGLAVCGTHGKTTTSALLAHTLKEVGTDPGAIIGSRVINWKGNALVGQGEYFIIEADEFQNKLQMYDPKAVILTSLDWDHPDTFPTFTDYKKAFADFVERIPKTGFLIVWGDSTDTLEVAKKCSAKVLTHGFGEENDYRIKNNCQEFEIFFKENSLGKFKTKLIGKHNLLNIAAVVATCHKLNLDMEKVQRGVESFQGTKRRFEYIGQRNGAVLIDDYGHHPEELKVTLKAAKEKYPNKNIWAIFHPHSYTRTEALLDEFSQSFSDADKVLVLDIYGSAREGSGEVDSNTLVKLINKFDRDKAVYIPTIDEAVEFLKNKIGENDVVVCIGAGNVFEVAEKLKEK